MRISRAAVAVAMCGSAVGCGLCGGNPELEPEARALGTARGGGADLEVTANLLGRYGTERHGGGRMTWTSETDEEQWRIAVAVTGAELVPLVPTWNDEWAVWRGVERETGAAMLDGLELVSCPADDGIVLGVLGLSSPRWLAARAGDGWGFYAPFESSATDCAAAPDAPQPLGHLRAVREDALRAVLELEEEREEQPGVAMGSEGRARRAAGQMLEARFDSLAEFLERTKGSST